MKLEWDDAKRSATLSERGLDFSDAEFIFTGRCVTMPDQRKDYGEVRYLTFGELQERVVVICWTWRGENLRVISMRKANEREIQAYRQRLESS